MVVWFYKLYEFTNDKPGKTIPTVSKIVNYQDGKTSTDRSPQQRL